MIKKILTIAKNLKTFSVDDVLIFTEADASEVENILKKLVSEQQLRHENNKYFYIHKPINLCTIEIKENKSDIIRPCGSLNFVEASKIFLKEHASKNCSYETQRTYNSMFKNNLNLFFKDFLLENIEIEDVNRFKEFSIKRGYCEKRTKNCLALLNQLLKYFRNSGYTKRLCEFQVKRLNNPKEIIILGDEMVNKIKVLSKKYYAPLYLIIEIILNTGLKFYEIMALGEEDIDFNNRTIFITKTSIKGKITMIKAKNQRRIVNFPQKSDAVLMQYIKCEKFSENIIQANFAKVKNKIGLREFKMDFFRHAFALNFLKQGNSVEKLYLQLGDYSIQATLEKYKKFIS